MTTWVERSFQTDIWGNENVHEIGSDNGVRVVMSARQEDNITMSAFIIALGSLVMGRVTD